ncbi:MAG TPA: N-acetylmuramoyl-L-alanine amidase, partial [Flavobacterium sp.]|nr:N-acetylmuramoyl-L-alanine amidase [Flavobacterium sp.]
MPRVLIEMGFVSNKEEGAFLNSESGQEKLAEAIANSILEYKNEYFSSLEKSVLPGIDKKDEKVNEIVKIKENKPESTTKTNDEVIIYKIQIAASKTNLATLPSNFKGLRNITKQNEGSYYKYFYEETKQFAEAKKNLETAKQKGYKLAFIVGFKNGEKVNISQEYK